MPMIKDVKNVFISLSFEKTVLPPFEDILILGRENPLGMNGVGQCLDLLVPDGFDRFEVEDDHVAAIIVNKNILLRLKAIEVIKILQTKVFPFVGKSEIVKVDFTTKITYENFAAEL
jgi:hypothetical protein